MDEWRKCNNCCLGSEKPGGINILVNNTATNPYYGLIVDSEDWAWGKAFGVNLMGPYRLSRAVAKEMGESGGDLIVNVASFSGLSVTLLQRMHLVAKVGLVIMLTKGWHENWENPASA